MENVKQQMQFAQHAIDKIVAYSYITKSLLLFFLIFSVTSLAQKKTIKLNSESVYKSYDGVSLANYKSVQLRDNTVQSPNLALGVSIAGGGSRAQYFSTGVLLGLENIYLEKPSKNFLSEIDYYSTVSGGCYGASFYLTLKANGLLNGSSFNKFYYSKDNVYEDNVYKGATATRILLNYANETGAFGSMAEHLDFAVLQNTKPNIHRMYLDEFFVDNDSLKPVLLPMLVANATIWNNGERFPFMPHIIKSAGIIDADKPNQEEFQKERGVFTGYRFPLSHAITASSAFPGVLPKTKFLLSNTAKTNEILCMIDGGAVDNFGYRTLAELLHDDKVASKNKRGLIIDCSGEGKLGQTSPRRYIGIFNLLGVSSLFTVQTRYMSMETDSKIYFDSKIPGSKSEIISMGTIREHLNKMPKSKDYTDYVKKMKALKDKDKNWFALYVDFRNALIKRLTEKEFYKENNIKNYVGSLSFNKMDQLTAQEVLLIYEYASQVITKLKITEDEGEMLILAGKLAVHIKRKELRDLLELK